MISSDKGVNVEILYFAWICSFLSKQFHEKINIMNMRIE